MPLPQFRRVKTADDDLRQVQDAVGFVFQDVLSKPILDGRLISEVSINGATEINHGLKRKPQGYLVVLKDSNVDIWDNQSTNQFPSLTLALNSSGPVVASLWIF